MANYTVLGNSDADAEIDTPNVAIRTERRAASFRILVTADDHTEVLVRHGEKLKSPLRRAARAWARTSSLPFAAPEPIRSIASAKRPPAMILTSGIRIATG